MRIKLLGLALILALVCPEITPAIDFKISGQWQVFFEVSNVTPRSAKGTDKFGAMQRFRTQLEAIASENLSGTVQFEIGSINWGQARTGGALGADGNIIELRHAYLDWTVPETAIRTRMGIQPIVLPGFLAGTSAVFAQDMAGISISAPLVEHDTNSIQISGFWARPYNDNSINYFHDDGTLHLDNLDVFALTVPMKFEGMEIIPWGMYTLIGKYSLSGLQITNEPAIVAPRGGLTPVFGGSNTYVNFQDTRLRGLDRPWGDGFWFGLDFRKSIGENWAFAFEGTYGHVDMGSVSGYTGFGDPQGRTFHLRREGWFAGMKLEYMADWGVPGLLLWYGSGDDDNPYNGSERLPQFNSPWMVTSLGFGASPIDEVTWKVLGSNPGGLMAAIAKIRNMSFPDILPRELTWELALAGYLGTNSPKMPHRANMQWPTRADGPMAYLTTMDNAWEANFRTDYKMYENFHINLDAAYVRVNLSESVWGEARKAQKKDNYRISLLFTYDF